MKKQFASLALLVALLCAGSAQAQSQPPSRDYSKVISDIALTCPAAFQKAANGRAVFKNAPVTDAFRRQVIPYIVGELNKLDPGKWGVLYRMDRQDETPEPGRLTTDVAIWIPGRLHYDVMGDQNTSWGVIGPLPNDKDWFIKNPSEFPTVCGSVTPPPPPPPPPPVDDSRIADLERKVGDVSAKLNDLLNQFAELVKVVNGNAIALKQVADGLELEVGNRIEVDAAHDQALEVIKSRPIPDGCRVQFVSCRLTFPVQ